jgi:protein arginine kinase
MPFYNINLEFIKNKFGSWLSDIDKNSDIVISSRIRLARNIEGVPFPNRAGEEKLKEIREEIKCKALLLAYFNEAIVLDMETLSSLDKQLLRERHVISMELAKANWSSLLLNKDEYLSLMINEEDHIRLCILAGGMKLEATWELIEKVENELSNVLNFAVSPELGYLTACPTNVGTGMRASLMLHLIGLTISRQIHRIIPDMTKLGVTIRGIYGEGTEALGELFQISNQVTLGRKEEEFVEQVISVGQQLVTFEREIRENLFKQQRTKIEDKIYRAYSIFKNARIISSKEAMELLSFIRLGVSLGLIKDISLPSLNQLLILVQPAHIQLFVGSILNVPQRDVKRATIIHEYLAK